MPELPEVETIKNDLLLQIAGRFFIKVVLNWEGIVRQPSPEEFCHKLVGQRVEGVKRRGKYLLFELPGDETLILHLKMSGSLLLKPISADPDSYTRAIFYFDDGRELRFCDRRKLGVMWLVKDRTEVVGKLGPEPLEPDFNVEVLSQLLSQRRAPIKALLCDQSFLAGVGNMYADEALFRAHIHPLREARSLAREEVNLLHRTIVQVLRRGIRRGGASVDTYLRPGGELGTAHFDFQVAHRGGKPCPLCGTPIRRIALRGRGTYFCPRCQVI